MAEYEMTGNNNDKAECTRFLALIDKRLDREITPEEDRELDEHLAVCPSCLKEMNSFAVVENLLHEAMDEPVEVPEGFFESLEAGLDEVKPVRGLALIFSIPLLAEQRGRALALASLVLVVVLTLGVGKGISERMNHSGSLNYAAGPTQAMIQTNSGDTIVLSGDEGDPDKYSEALDDLERAYRESLGEQGSTDAEGYIHTSWSGGDNATPIH